MNKCSEERKALSELAAINIINAVMNKRTDRQEKYFEGEARRQKLFLDAKRSLQITLSVSQLCLSLQQ